MLVVLALTVSDIIVAFGVMVSSGLAKATAVIARFSPAPSWEIATLIDA